MTGRLTGCLLILILATAHAQQPSGQPHESRQTEYLQLEQEIQKLARSYRQLEQHGDETLSAKRREQLVDELEELVNKAFDLRQEMRREDVRRLRARLKKVEATVDQREQAKQEIIEHRVANLLDADRDPTLPAPLRNLSAPPYTQPRSIPGGGPPVEGPQSYPPGTTAVPAFPTPLAQPNRPATGLPGMRSTGEHLALLRAEAQNLESLHAAAERCVRAAEAADRAQWEQCLAAYRAVEQRFQAYVELTEFEVQAADAKLLDITKRVARLKGLFESGTISTGEYDEAQSELTLREIDVKRAHVAKDFFEQLLADAKKIVDRAAAKIQDQSGR